MKLYKNIIIISVIILLLLGAFLAVCFMMPGEKTPQVVENSEIETVNVFSVDSELVTKISVKSQEEEYYITKNGDEWTLSGESGLNVSKTKMQSLVYVTSSVSATKIISENSQDAEKFGFNVNSSSITVYTRDGNSKTLLIGDTTLDKENVYIKLSDEDTIYLKSASGIKSLIPDYKSFINMELVSVDLSNLSLLTHVYIEKDGNTPIKLEYTEVDEGSRAWRMLSPVYAEVNGQVLSDNVLTNISEFKASQIAEAHPDDISLYGFDKPYAEFSIGYDQKTTKLIFGDEYNGYRFVMISGFDTVYMVKTSELDFLDVPYQNLMSRLIHVEYLDKISKVEVTTKDESILMEANESSYRINGQEIEKSRFSKAYQAIIGISLDSVDLSPATNVTPDVTIKYTRKDGSVAKVDFISVSERNYRALVDGKGNCIAAKKNVTEAIEFVLSTLN